MCRSDSTLSLSLFNRDEVKEERISREKSQNVAEELARASVLRSKILEPQALNGFRTSARFQ